MPSIKLSAEIKQQIRTGIDGIMLMESLTQQGWTRVDLERFENNQHAVDIRCWVSENCTGKFHNFGRSWIFENSQEAVMFKLKWT